MRENKKAIMIVAGEASGDALGAGLMEALASRYPGASFFGAAGPKMRELGAEPVVFADELAIIGIPEIAKSLPMFWRVFKTLKKAALERKPDVAILIDFPEFNLKLAKSLRKIGLKVVYYVSPQIWAWREYRIKQVRESVDLLLSILPFEERWYEERGFSRAVYIGHPLAAEIAADMATQKLPDGLELGPGEKLIALLPGSRRKEVSKILPPMLEAAALLYEAHSHVRFAIAVAPGRKREEFEKILDRSRSQLPRILFIEGQTKELLSAADLAIVASGTATLETGLAGTPMIIVYKVSPINFHLLRPFISVPHFGLINLIAEERLAPELIQGDCTGETIAAEALRLLEPEANLLFRAKLAEVKAKMGEGDASQKAAAAIIENFLK